MPEVLVWNENDNRYDMQSSDLSYIQLINAEMATLEQKFRRENPSIEPDKNTLRQNAMIRVSDNYIDYTAESIIPKIQIIIGILIIKKLELDTSNETNATIVNDFISGFLDKLHNSVVKTKNNTNIHSIDSKKSALNSIVETLVDNHFSGLEQFRTNFKPLLRLKSLLKHYVLL